MKISRDRRSSADTGSAEARADRARRRARSRPGRRCIRRARGAGRRAGYRIDRPRSDAAAQRRLRAACRELRRDWPGIPLLVLSATHDRATVETRARSGGDGLHSEDRQCARADRRVATGAFRRRIRAARLSANRQRPRPRAAARVARPGLDSCASPTCLRLLVQGKPNKLICRDLAPVRRHGESACQRNPARAQRAQPHASRDRARAARRPASNTHTATAALKRRSRLVALLTALAPPLRAARSRRPGRRRCSRSGRARPRRWCWAAPF
mgnify:CR=1 FL=1